MRYRAKSGELEPSIELFKSTLNDGIISENGLDSTLIKWL